MKPIRVLPRAVAERIAAGEVIERPSSVVKELVENSLDAGATEVAVILEDGGKSLIEVIDNGHGIAGEDIPVALKRHATSKLQSLDDLDRISTLGFRGEALPSIAAVSELQILSRSKESSTAYELDLGSQYFNSDTVSDAKPATFGHFLGSPHGTRIRARGLFSQIPARLKFLKSQGAEVSQVREWMERLALTHPHVGFRLVSDDRTVMTLRPQTEEDRVRALLADGEDFPLVSYMDADSDEDLRSHIKVRIHWLQGLSVAHTRKLVQVVNKRAVRDRLLQQATLAAFRQALLPGQFPAVAIFVDIPTDRLDVNVHPTKTELRFLDGSRIFRVISSKIEELIGRHGAPAYAGGISGPSWASSPDVMDRPTGSAPFNLSQTSAQSNYSSGFNWSKPPVLSTPSLWSAKESSAGVPESVETAAAAPTAADRPEHPFQPDRFTGILFNTYLLYDLGGELGMVDQHAAHERVRYERLKRRALGRAAAPQPQQLLLPEAVTFKPEQRLNLESRLGWLEKLGFEAEIFGEESALFRAIPGEWGTDELRTRLKNLIDRVLSAEEAPNEAAPKELAMDENLFERLASEACHSAIRAGDRIGIHEATALLDDLFRCEHPWNCPHGRPTVARIPRARFEEWFQRRV